MYTSCFTQPFLLYMFVVTDFAVPHEKALFTFSPGAHNQHDLSSYSQLSHHAFQQYQLGGIPQGHSMKSDSGLMTGGPLWDVENLVGGYSGSSGHQPGSSQAGETDVTNKAVSGKVLTVMLLCCLA